MTVMRRLTEVDSVSLMGTSSMGINLLSWSTSIQKISNPLPALFTKVVCTFLPGNECVLMAIRAVVATTHLIIRNIPGFSFHNGNRELKLLFVQGSQTPILISCSCDDGDSNEEF